MFYEPIKRHATIWSFERFKYYYERATPNK